MAGSSNQYAYQLGATLVSIGTNGVSQVLPPRGCNGVYFGWQSGGSLSIMQGPGASGGLGGYLMGTSEHITIEGPATFFLAATGATSVAAIVFKYSSGYSLTP